MTPMPLQCPSYDREDDVRHNHHSPRESTGSKSQSLQRVRNKTGLVGHHEKIWSDDPHVNELWQRLSAPPGDDVRSLQESLVRHTLTTLARTWFNFDNFASYQAAALTVRDQLIARWDETQQHHTRHDLKRVYYLSMEFLMGRSLCNAVLNLGLSGSLAEAMRQLGLSLEEAAEQEVDAALGNGGLGRLAACFMDSLATLNYPAWGYGLRYTFGIFQQQIKDGHQVEYPDYWLTFGNPWEVERLDVVYPVRFGGQVHRQVDASGVARYHWEPTFAVEAVAYDVPIPGFATKSTINIRLWASKPPHRQSFDLHSFNEGNYQKSVEEQQRAEQITSVLYPADNTAAGKELRLKQQYFFVSATLQDIIRRFRKSNRPWTQLPQQVAIQLNDTHPSLGIAELQRILVDEQGLGWDEAWSLVTQVFSFTNHTVLPEALEKWPVELMASLLPRHLQIIYDINLFFLQRVEAHFPADRARLARMSIIEEAPQRQVRMAHLAIIGSHVVNGVAALHSTLIKQTIFADFVDFYGGGKFQNKTNGITPRRWLYQANPELAELIAGKLAAAGPDSQSQQNTAANPTNGLSWLVQLDRLTELKKWADNPEFQARWDAVKSKKKLALAETIREKCRLLVDPDALFDVQVKRIHEYKRQSMNILQVIHRYLWLQSAAASPKQLADAVPRVVIFAGKAAPAYVMAKLIIKLINNVAQVVNADPRTNRWLQVVFLPDYNVSLAEKIIPASDLSEHISTAGTEASGTSNMKFALNGGLIIGTRDGANIEIAEAIGEERMFIFGCAASEVEDIRHAQRYHGMEIDAELAKVFAAIREGVFGDPATFAPLIDGVTCGGDHYLVSHDFASYLDAQRKVDEAYRDRPTWIRNSILSTACMGYFSSDRSIREYAEQIWNIKPAPLPSQ